MGAEDQPTTTTSDEESMLFSGEDETPKVKTQLDRPIVFTHDPLLPQSKMFDLFAYTPNEWIRNCWNLSPPICPECGLVFTRPVDNLDPAKKVTQADRNKRWARQFCSRPCHARWTRRLANRWVPAKWRGKDWEGKHDGAAPPEFQEMHATWNRFADNGNQHRSLASFDLCGKPCIGYPTNTFPNVPDNRGKMCANPAGTGTNHPGVGPCRWHGGIKASVVKKARRELAIREAVERQMIFGMSIEITPEEAIMQELWRTNGAVEWYRQKIEALSNPDPDSVEDAALTQFTKAGMTPSVWVSLYNQERDRLAVVAKTAAGMGIAERSIRIVEEQGRILATVIQSLMTHPLLALTPMQQVNAKDAIREVLATIKMPGTAPELPAAGRVMMPDGLTKDTHDFLDSVAIDADAEDDDDLEEL